MNDDGGYNERCELITGDDEHSTMDEDQSIKDDDGYNERSGVNNER